MRGKHYIAALVRKLFRITPAYAGKTHLRIVPKRIAWDHPRVCGENIGMKLAAKSFTGSPPRMRGKRIKSVLKNTNVRITPAYAGKTVLFSGAMQPPWDHPRVCGENKAKPHEMGSFPGSPPRMRGKHIYRLSARIYDRITPAYAGKT